MNRHNLNFALIGYGSIAQSLLTAISPKDCVKLRNLLVRPERIAELGHLEDKGFTPVTTVDALDSQVTTVIETAGHSAVAQHGYDIIESGRDFAIVSAGALTDDSLRRRLTQFADSKGRCFMVISGAIGALDALSTYAAAGPQEVTYYGIKPPIAWQGTAAESVLDLKQLDSAKTFFEGNVREVAQLYPKNTNVAATVALAGVGFEQTRVKLVADPHTTVNRHVIEAKGPLGQFRFEIGAAPSSSNPKTSASTAYSVLSFIRNGSNVIHLH